MNSQKSEANDGLSSEDDSTTVPIRVIRQAIEAISKHNIVITKLAIGFKKSKE